VINKWILRGSVAGPLDLEVCWNSRSIWDYAIPKEDSLHKKAVKLGDMPNVGCVVRSLLNSTNWGRRFFLRGSTPIKCNDRTIGPAITVSGRDLCLLIAGFHSVGGNTKIPLYSLLAMPVSGAGMARLRQAMATVDGFLHQMLLAFLEVKGTQNWAFWDRVLHALLCMFVPDYFPGSKGSAYAELKSLRQGVKEHGFNPTLMDLSKLQVPRRFSFLRPLIKSLEGSLHVRQVFVVGLLSQTRASGIPPPALKQAAVDKAVALFREPSSTALVRRFADSIDVGVDRVFDTLIRKHGSIENTRRVFRLAIEKAKISLSDSAEFSVPQRDGGKLEAARRVIADFPRGVPRVCLETGKRLEVVVPRSGTQGEFLFSWALGAFRAELRKGPDGKFHFPQAGPYKTGVMDVRIHPVAELGKYRTITVSTLAHALVLHPLSHVGLEILKDLPSSAAGVSAANQAWELFRRLSGENPAAGFLFDEKPKFVVSTDWETATDYCDHLVARRILRRFLWRMGCPSFYGEACCFALTHPRRVHHSVGNEQSWYSTRAVLMGDPMTKVILHLYHPVARVIAEKALRLSAHAEAVRSETGVDS